MRLSECQQIGLRSLCERWYKTVQRVVCGSCWCFRAERSPKALGRALEPGKEQTGWSRHKLMTCAVCWYCRLSFRLKADTLSSGDGGTAPAGSDLPVWKRSVPGTFATWVGAGIFLTSEEAQVWSGRVALTVLPQLEGLPAPGTQCSWLWRSSRDGRIQQEVLMSWAPRKIWLPFSLPLLFQRAIKLHRTCLLHHCCVWMTLQHTWPKYHIKYTRWW